MITHTHTVHYSLITYHGTVNDYDISKQSQTNINPVIIDLHVIWSKTSFWPLYLRSK